MGDDNPPAPPLAQPNDLSPRSPEDRAADERRTHLFAKSFPSFSLMLNNWFAPCQPLKEHFIFWDNGAAPHLKMWTAAFVDIRTGEVFLAAPRTLDLDLTKKPIFDRHFWWFQQKIAARDAVAARALDCFVYREKESPSSYARYSAEQPYSLQQHDGFGLSEAPFWFTLLPEQTQQTIKDVQNSIRDIPNLPAMQEVPNLAVVPPIEEAENAWQEQPFARPSALNPREELFLYYRVIHGIRLENENYIFWEWWNTHHEAYIFTCVIVCPLCGELFGADGPSQDQAGVFAAEAALSVIKDRRDLDYENPDGDIDPGLADDIQPLTEVHPMWVQCTGMKIRLLQKKAVRPLQSIRDMQVEEMDEPDDEGGNNPLVSLHHWLQKHEKKNVPRSSFVTFVHVSKPQLISCVWVNPVSGEICRPGKLDLEEEGLSWSCANVQLDDRQDGESSSEDFQRATKEAKARAKMSAAKSALAVLKWRVQTNQPYDEQEIDLKFLSKVPNSACEQIVELALQASPTVSSTLLEGRETIVNLDGEEDLLSNNASVDMEIASAKVNRSAEEPFELDSAYSKPADGPIPLDTKPNHYQPINKGTPVHDLEYIYRIPKGERQKFGEQFTLWWKISESLEVLWTGVFECPNSGEVFLSAPYGRNAAERDMHNVWWFRKKVNARQSAAARAFDIHCFRNDYTKTERYCDQEVFSGSDEAVTLSDLASMGLRKEIAFEEPTEEPIDG